MYSFEGHLGSCLRIIFWNISWIWSFLCLLPINFVFLYPREGKWPLWIIMIQKDYVLVAESCMTLCDPIDCSPSGSSVHGILQARIMEWAAIPFSRETSQPRDWTLVSRITGRFFTVWAYIQCSNSKMFKVMN